MGVVTVEEGTVHSVVMVGEATIAEDDEALMLVELELADATPSTILVELSITEFPEADGMLAVDVEDDTEGMVELVVVPPSEDVAPGPTQLVPVKPAGVVGLELA